ncbi:hypothetical protein YB2330_005131 [Saitoella coloradoensis]
MATAADFSALKIPELKAKCKELAVAVGGTKPVLVARICAKLGIEPPPTVEDKSEKKASKKKNDKAEGEEGGVKKKAKMGNETPNIPSMNSERALVLDAPLYRPGVAFAIAYTPGVVVGRTPAPTFAEVRTVSPPSVPSALTLPATTSLDTLATSTAPEPLPPVISDVITPERPPAAAAPPTSSSTSKKRKTPPADPNAPKKPRKKKDVLVTATDRNPTVQAVRDGVMAPPFSTPGGTSAATSTPTPVSVAVTPVTKKVAKPRKKKDILAPILSPASVTVRSSPVTPAAGKSFAPTTQPPVRNTKPTSTSTFDFPVQASPNRPPKAVFLPATATATATTHPPSNVTQIEASDVRKKPVRKDPVEKVPVTVKLGGKPSFKPLVAKVPPKASEEGGILAPVGDARWNEEAPAPVFAPAEVVRSRKIVIGEKVKRAKIQLAINFKPQPVSPSVPEPELIDDTLPTLTYTTLDSAIPPPSLNPYKPPSLRTRKFVTKLSTILAFAAYYGTDKPWEVLMPATCASKDWAHAAANAWGKVCEMEFGGDRLEGYFGRCGEESRGGYMRLYYEHRAREIRDKVRVVKAGWVERLFEVLGAKRGQYGVRFRGVSLRLLDEKEGIFNAWDVAIRFWIARFALKAGSAGCGKWTSPAAFLRDVEETRVESCVPVGSGSEEIWRVEVGSGDVYFVLGETGEAVGWAPPETPETEDKGQRRGGMARKKTLGGSSTPLSVGRKRRTSTGGGGGGGEQLSWKELRGDWKGRIADLLGHGATGGGKGKKRLMDRVFYYGDSVNYPRGIHTSFKAGEQERSLQLKLKQTQLAERFVLGHVIPNSISGSAIYPVSLPTKSSTPVFKIALDLELKYGVESVRVGSAGEVAFYNKRMSSGVGFVRCCGGGWFVLAETGQEIGNEEEGIVEFWQMCLGVDGWGASVGEGERQRRVRAGWFLSEGGD